MELEFFLKSVILIIGILIIIITIILPTQKTGILNDVTDLNVYLKPRGRELFLRRLMVILIVLFFGLSLCYGYVHSNNNVTTDNTSETVSETTEDTTEETPVE